MTRYRGFEIGDRFGKLIITEELSPIVDSQGRKKRVVKCDCDCGNVIEKILFNQIQQGHTRSCGCLISEAKRKVNVFKERDDGLVDVYNPSGNRIIFVCDISDVSLLKDYCWVLTEGRIRSHKRNGDRLEIGRFLMSQYLEKEIDKNYYVDHINKNPLDNRRCNLRIASKQQNNWNKSKRKNSKNSVIGVRTSSKNKFISEIEVGDIRRWKFFYNYRDAVRQRLIWEKELYGDFSPQINLFEEFGI